MAKKVSINVDALMKLPIGKRVGILVAANVVIMALIAWFLIWPSYSLMSGYRAKLEELNATLVKDRKIAADIPKYLNEKKQMLDSLDKALTQLPNDREIPDLMDSISTRAQRAGLKIFTFKPGAEVAKGFYAEVPVSMTVEGKFEGLYDFTQKVASLPRIVNLGSMIIVSKGHVNNTPMLKADFVATTFRFIAPQDEPAKAAEPKAPAKKPSEEG